MKLLPKLFKTTTRRTYRKPRQRAGWSTTSKASTRAKRWFRRGRKKLWRTAKRRIRRRWKQRQRRRERQRQRRNATYNRQLARSQQPTGSYQVDASGGVSYQPGPAEVGGGQAKLPPPPDGALSTCRRCSNEVEYNGGRERWEHTGRGHAECFKPGGYA